MIESIEIKNLRGIREGKLEGLTPLTVLVGPNGCGKSTILDALLIGAHPEPPEAVGQAVARRAGVDEGARWLVWHADNSRSIQLGVRSVGAGGSRACALIFERPRQHEVARVQFKAPGAQGVRQSVGIVFLQGNEYQYTKETKFLEVVPEVRMVETGARKGESLHTLYTQAVVQGRRDQTVAILKDLLPSLRDIVILTEQDRPILHFVYEDFSVPAALAGDGVHALLRLVLETATRQRGLLLIEEPELHLHPAAIARSARVIVAAARTEVQLVLSTHSLEFIDCVLAVADEKDLERLSVFRLKLDNGGLISSRLTGKEVAFERNQIEDDLR